MYDRYVTQVGQGSGNIFTIRIAQTKASQLTKINITQYQYPQWTESLLTKIKNFSVPPSETFAFKKF